MSEATAAFFAGADRVPVWTRPTASGFTARAANEAGGFARWGGANDEPLAHTEPAAPGAEALVAQGYAAGLAEGRRQADAALADERDALRRLAQGLEALNPAESDGLAGVLASAVGRLVAQIVGEVAVDAETLAARCQTVAAAVAEETTPQRLRLHPTDAARLAGCDFAVAVVGDPLLAPGTIVLDTAAGWVEDSPAIRLERLRSALDKLGAPQ
jgi:flagellar assembly protein FliH